jgi:hypothetical protein
MGHDGIQLDSPTLEYADVIPMMMVPWSEVSSFIVRRLYEPSL